MSQRVVDTLWGSTGAAVDPGDTKLNLGWIAEIPIHETQNYWQLRADEAMQTQQQHGIEPWNALFIYADQGLTRGSDGFVYESEQASNLNHNPVGDSGVWWRLHTRTFRDDKEGLRGTWNTATSYTTAAGNIRNQANTKWLSLAADHEKNPTTLWAVGDGPTIGSLADTVTLAEGMLRKFLVNKPDGTAEIVLDTDVAADNFFSSAAASSAGYTDATLYRRIDYIFIDSGLTMPQYYNQISDPNRYLWEDPVLLQVAGVSTSARDTFDCDRIPPSTLGEFVFAQFSDVSAGGNLYVSTEEQADVAIGSRWTTTCDALGASTTKHSMVRSEWQVSTASKLYVRANTADMIAQLHQHGWIDNLLVA